MVFTQTITFGEYFTLLFYSFLLFNPLYELPTLAANRQEVKASNDILTEIHSLPLEERPSSPKQITSIDSIVFKDVSFGYNDAEYALENVSFAVHPGETIAFV